MPVGLIGRKVGMTQVFTEDGGVIPVTVVEAGPCSVLQVKTVDTDGYEAVQLGYGQKSRNSAIKAERGHVAALSSKRSAKRAEAGVEAPAKAGVEPPVVVREFRTDGEDHGLEVGGQVGVSALAELTHVDVIGTSKGRGFAGAMKRHNFSGQRASHGVKKVHRRVGSIGMSADPSRVLKGTRMAGQYGNVRCTVRHLQVVSIDEEKNLLVLKGAVPGPSGSTVVVRPTNKFD